MADYPVCRHCGERLEKYNSYNGPVDVLVRQMCNAYPAGVLVVATVEVDERVPQKVVPREVVMIPRLPGPGGVGG